MQYTLYTCQVTIQVGKTNQEYIDEVLEDYNSNIFRAIDSYIFGNGIARVVSVTKLTPSEQL